MIFERLGIDTLEVLQAAGTKWNFIALSAGAGGRACIGVDPYYLNRQGRVFGVSPEIILAGRRNQRRHGQICGRAHRQMMIAAGKPVLGARIAILGITFKEDVPTCATPRWWILFAS